MFMQLMEDSTDMPNVNMIPFPTCTIPNRENIQTYVMGTHLNKAIKADSSIPWISAPTELSSKTTPSIHKLQCYGVVIQ
jgi:hypothetical protein